MEDLKTAVRAIIAELRTRQKQTLPMDWKNGLKCPECGLSSDRPKCFFEYGPTCPRHDPEQYDPLPYVMVPEPQSQQMADRLEAALNR